MTIIGWRPLRRAWRACRRILRYVRSRSPPQGRLGRVQRVAEIPHRVWFAVGVCGEGGAHRGAEVGAVKPGALEFGGKAGDFGRECRRVSLAPRCDSWPYPGTQATGSAPTQIPYAPILAMSYSMRT